jgi:CRP-like cAMP-binding protein
VSSSARAAVRTTATSHPAGESARHSPDGPGGRRSAAWSKARLSAAVAATRCGRVPVPSEQPLRDEVEFFGAVGIRQNVRSGAALARRGTRVDEVHLVERGALAVIGDHGGRSPILAFALRRDLCCAVPALLHEATPWDAVAVMDSSVITMSADAFTAAVRDRWVDRWTTRTLTWLAEVGTRMADLDEPDPKAQVAALLLRFRGTHSEELCRRTIADLLDLDDLTTRDILSDLERVGAVSHAGGRISVVRSEMLRATITAVGRPQRRATSRARISRRDAPRAVAVG